MVILLPTTAIRAGGRAAWMVAVLAGVVGFLTALLIGKLSQRFPGVTFVGYAGRIVGRWPGKLLGLVLGILLAVNASADLRVAMGMVLGVFFVTTPHWVVALLMALTALAITWFGIVHASRLGPLLLIGLAVVFGLTFPLLWRWMQPGYLIPLWDPSPIQEPGPFYAALSSFRSGYLLTALMPYVANPRRAMRVYGWAYWFAWLGVLLAVLAPVMVFSPEGARTISVPFPYVITIIRLPNFPVERLEMVARMAYNLNVLYAVGLSYWTSGTLLSEVFNTQRTRPFMLAALGLSLLPVVLIVGDQPAATFTGAILIGTQVLVWAIFALLWLVYGIRRPALHPVSRETRSRSLRRRPQPL